MVWLSPDMHSTCIDALGSMTCMWVDSSNHTASCRRGSSFSPHCGTASPPRGVSSVACTQFLDTYATASSVHPSTHHHNLPPPTSAHTSVPPPPRATHSAQPNAPCHGQIPSPWPPRTYPTPLHSQPTTAIDVTLSITPAAGPHRSPPPPLRTHTPAKCVM